jgi:hypothetical protein
MSIECAFCDKSDSDCLFCKSNNDNLSCKNKEIIKKFIKDEIKKGIKINDYSQYKDIFEHPKDIELIITESDHDEFRNKFSEYEELRKFLNEIEYEMYNNFPGVDSIDKLKLYCVDYNRFLGVYMTYQSYVNRLRLANYIEYGRHVPIMKYYFKNKECCKDGCTIKVIRDHDVCIKYDISWYNKTKTPLSFTYGYDEFYTPPWSDEFVVYTKKIKTQ